MEQIHVFIAPAPGDMHRPFGILPDPLKVSRVPCVGELIALGEDEADHEATYRVVLVTHKNSAATTSATARRRGAARWWTPCAVDAPPA